MMRRLRIIGFVPLLAIVGGCTSTAPVIVKDETVSQPLNLMRAKVAVLSFTGAPGNPETGGAAREVAIGILVKSFSISLVSLSKVETYMKEHSFVPSQYDSEAIKKAAQELEADVVLWGSVNQFTPYRFDRLAPATPPYLEVTLFGFRVGQSSIGKVTGRKQGKLPVTIFNRQPTFADVAQPLLAQLLSQFR